MLILILFGLCSSNIFAQSPNVSQTEQYIDTVFLYQQVEEKPLFEMKDPFDNRVFYNYVRENSCECLFETYGYGIPAPYIIEFIIDIDGSLVNAKIIRAVDPSLDAEILRVVNNSPKWTPGKHNGKTVKVKCTLVISTISHGCVPPQGWLEDCIRCLEEKAKK